jgi:glycosyltransferase involved in cell wall biosynthesis
MNIHIAAPDIHVGDAVGNHCLALALDFAEEGHRCQLFAGSNTSPNQPVRPLAELIGGEAEHNSEDILLVSYSIYDPHLRQLLKLPGRKIVYFHGITPPELLLEHDPIAAYYCARGYAQLPLLAYFDHVVSNSSFNLHELRKHVHGRIPDKRTSVVPPISARFPLFSQPARANRQMRQNNEPLQLLTVGRVVPHKCVEDLIKVVALLEQQGTATHLNIVGSCNNAHYRSFLETDIRRHGLQERVHIHGMLSQESLILHYQSADLLLIASLHEGFCIPVLEAMQLGLPVMLRSGTAASEVLNMPEFEHKTPLSFSKGIQELRKDALTHAIQAGRKRAQKLLQTAELECWANTFSQAE